MKVVFDGKFEVGDVIAGDPFFGDYYQIKSCEEVEEGFLHDIKCCSGSTWRYLNTITTGQKFIKVFKTVSGHSIFTFNDTSPKIQKLVEKL